MRMLTPFTFTGPEALTLVGPELFNDNVDANVSQRAFEDLPSAPTR